MAHKFNSSNLSFNKVRKKNEVPKLCKKQSSALTKTAKFAAKVAIGSAISGDPTGAVAEEVIGLGVDSILS